MADNHIRLDKISTEKHTTRLQELYAKRFLKKLHKHRKDPLPPNERLELINALCSVIQSTRDEHEEITESTTDNIEDIKRDTDVALSLICEGLKKKAYDGQLIPIGSSYDGTRASANTDLDYLYQLTKLPTVSNVNDIQLESTDKTHARRLLINGEELTSRKVYSEFSKTLDSVCNTVDVKLFPEKLTFGGFAQPRFSGVRDNQPAATILFRWQDHTENWTDIPVDISVALILPYSKGIFDIIDTNTLASSHVSNGLHLVPVGVGDWQVTTAILEQRILMNIERDGPVTTIKECKAAVQCITRDLNTRCLKHTTPREKTKEYQAWLSSSFEQYNKCEPKNDELRKILAELLNFSHIVLTDEVTQNYSEIPAKYLSFNSSAIKYKVLTDTVLSDIHAVSPSKLDLIASVVRSPATHSFLSYGIRAFGVNLALVSIEQLLSVVNRYTQQHTRNQQHQQKQQPTEIETTAPKRKTTAPKRKKTAPKRKTKAPIRKTTAPKRKAATTTKQQQQNDKQQKLQHQQ